jgi:ferric iron reductase protein FhuF
MEKQTNTPNEDLQRFTTLINPKLLSDIKLISYFTNQKLYECVNNSMKCYIEDFELKNNTSISSIISLRDKFLDNTDDNTPLNPKEDTKDKK